MDHLDLIDPEQLLLRLSQGGALEPAEAQEIASVLKAALEPGLGRSPSLDDVYSYLVVVGKAKLFSLRHLVERFLDIQEPLTIAQVLEILCLEWGGTEDYLEYLLSFALGVAWDVDEDVRQIALKILGEYLALSLPGGDNNLVVLSEAKIRQQQRVLELLLNTYDDETVDQWTRQKAYSALCRAYGKSEEEVPSEYVPLDFDSEKIDRAMLETFRELVSQPG